jgi:3-oxoacyl-[acyl-carrier-protein] synthase-3
MAIIIRGLGKALPKKVVTNEELAPRIGSTDEWIRSHSGIVQRYVASAEETCASLSTDACLAALKRAGDIAPESIDLVICATSTPDYLTNPATACIIQHQLGASHAAAFDLVSACTGFITGVGVADSMLRRNGWRYALVAGTELVSTILDLSDRSTSFLFGDASGVVVLENTAVTMNDGCETGEKRGVGEVMLGSDGSGALAIHMDKEHKVRMDGHQVYVFATKMIGEIITGLMEKENLTMDDVDLFVCHQANERILQAAEKRLRIPEGKMVYNIANYGNTSSASIPVTLVDLLEAGRLKAGMTVISAGFGAGLTWGGMVLRF